jgi:hypothetical protein
MTYVEVERNGRISANSVSSIELLLCNTKVEVPLVMQGR